MKKILPTVILLSFLVGCMNTSDNLARETARTIGGLRPDQVTISDVKRGMTNVSWVATTSTGAIYDCASDDMVRRVNAVKRETK